MVNRCSFCSKALELKALDGRMFVENAYMEKCIGGSSTKPETEWETAAPFPAVMVTSICPVPVLFAI